MHAVIGKLFGLLTFEMTVWPPDASDSSLTYQHNDACGMIAAGLFGGYWNVCMGCCLNGSYLLCCATKCLVAWCSLRKHMDLSHFCIFSNTLRNTVVGLWKLTVP